MIKYVDIGDQIIEGKSQFAWWDTVAEKFIEFAGTQVWDSWGRFEADFFRMWNNQGYLLEWFKRLYPLNLNRDHPPEKELILEED